MKIIFLFLSFLSLPIAAQEKKDVKPAPPSEVSYSTASLKNKPDNNINSVKQQTAPKQVKTVQISTQTSTSNLSKSTSTVLSKNQIKKEDEEYSEVMTDVMETQSYYSFSDSQEQEKQEIMPIPLSYGKVKGVMIESGKSYLVLENEDGNIHLINVYFDKSGNFLWKLSGKFERN
ncbi:MAG: hypothetical protein GX447_01295 [Elusimicrobia bacterium]|nr:hypothetical protein [Elusimicrobiota bacterium]